MRRLSVAKDVTPPLIPLTRSWHALRSRQLVIDGYRTQALSPGAYLPAVLTERGSTLMGGYIQ
jgi:hypothetical protein